MKTVCFFLIALSLSMLSTFAESSWRTFTNKAGKTFQGKVLEVNAEKGEATVLAKKSNKKFTLKFSVLVENDVDYLKNWEPSAMTEPSPEEDVDTDTHLGKTKKRFYPKMKAEIAVKIKEIMGRIPPRGIEEKQQEAVNTLNVYRYLCGVPDKVKADKRMIDEATQAAKACKKNGALSHNLGSFTDKCNLATIGDIVETVSQYIDDSGANNRQKRGHRLWCLNPGMSKTGFGSAGASYSGMWALDGANASKRTERAYPGRGFFPLKYLHGTGWSLYLSEIAPNANDLKVEVFKLSSRPQKPFSMKADIPGQTVPVKFVATYENAVNFEPETSIVHQGGIFWVRVRGKGVRESYLVELY